MSYWLLVFPYLSSFVLLELELEEMQFVTLLILEVIVDPELAMALEEAAVLKLKLLVVNH